MKTIALIPAKNEEILLPLCLESLKLVADEIIVYDDHSTDATAEIARKYGAHVITESYATNSGWPEYEIRERLLLEARARKATHIISLDADEALTPNFAKVAKDYLSKLKPGDALSLRWITLWKNERNERIDGVFADLYKDFAFCDDNVSHHQYAFLGVGRIPHNLSGQHNKVPLELGGILHFQYATWGKTQIKQAWYRCSELIKNERTAKRINHTYSISLDNHYVSTKPLPQEWIVELADVRQTPITSLWQYQDILKFFETKGIEFFEPLEIWHIPELHHMFVEKTGREPKIKVFPKWLVYLNKIKNKILHG